MRRIVSRSQDHDPAPSLPKGAFLKLRAHFTTVRFNAIDASEPPLVISSPTGVDPLDYRATLLTVADAADFAALRAADQTLKAEIKRVFETQRTNHSEKTIGRAMMRTVQAYGKSHPAITPRLPEIR